MFQVEKKKKKCRLKVWKDFCVKVIDVPAMRINDHCRVH